MKSYFDELEQSALKAYAVAREARGKGYDPEQDVEIPMAEDLALRAQELTGVKNTAEKIRELSEEYDREEVSIHIAREVANRDEGSVKERLEDAVRIGLAVLTEGILVAPLEGIGGLDIKDNSDGTNYVELSFAGPIRSAGGTGQAMSVLIADVVRRELGIGSYKATTGEVQRFKEEVPLYKKTRSLQYTPSAEEIEVIVKGCPISISGEGTESEEVSGNRNLPRVDTNRVRGGACLVLAEGMCLKAQKLKKYVDKLDIEGWEFIDEYIEKFASSKKDSDDEKQEGISPNFKYIKDTIAGRPVFGHPSVKGGFRLRYGRSRTLGLAAIAVNPAVMFLTDEFMALGTQIKIERPGKAGAVTPCDTIEGPTVLFHNGKVKRIDNYEEAKEVTSKVKEILDLGEMLIPYGEFLENNHPLVPAAYCHEWWIQEVDVELNEDEMTPEKAVELSREQGYPLHPKYIYFWDYVGVSELRRLREFVSDNSRIDEGLYISNDEEIKKILEDIGLPHELKDDEIYVEIYRPFLFTLGIEEGDLELHGESQKEDLIEYLSELSGVKIRSKAPTTIGARMARPEKTKERKMNPPVHGLFPLGSAGGNQRLVNKAVENGIIEVEVSARRCSKCGKSGAQIRCTCGGRRELLENDMGNGGPKKQKLDMASKYREALRNIGEGGNVKRVKGVKGLMTKEKTPEALEKAILRAKHNIWVFKDGTCRYDMTDLPVTHFKPEEIGLSVDKARKLGYKKDIHGEPLEDSDQMLELKTQDFIASRAAGMYLVKIAKFVDDLLEKYYDIDPFYEAERKEDLIGELVVGLAPHTSGGVLGRLIGYHEGKAGYAHPFFHAAKRRNCFSPDTKLWIKSKGDWTLKPIEEIVEKELTRGDTKYDDFGTEYKGMDNLFVPSISKDGEESLMKVSCVSKHPAPNHYIEFKTRSGRELKVTPQHKMLKAGDKIEFYRAFDLEEGDLIPSPKKIEMEGKENKIDLLKELSKIPDIEETIMIRSISSDFLKSTFRQKFSTNSYLKKLSEETGINKKTISSYIQRCSFPYWIMKKIFGDQTFEILPEEIKLGSKRDEISINRYITIDEDFSKLIGYYTAEGFARKKKGNFYQVTICIPDRDSRDFLKKVYKHKLGINAFEENEWKITASSKLIYFLFNNVLGTGNKAKNKKIPTQILLSNKRCLSSFLSGYFSGDGTTSSKRLDIRASTVSKRLADEIIYSLKRFGINSKLYKEERDPSGIVKEFYEEKGIDHTDKIFTAHIIKITSKNIVKFKKEIGFDTNRKSNSLKDSLENTSVGTQRLMTDNCNIWFDEIVDKKIVKNSDDYVYSLTVNDNHTLVANDLYVGQCDGDEDCIMLLMDGLLNFSQKFLPEKRGGKMDAPLVLTTKINPDEIDSEAHNVDCLWKYPLEFYEKTFEYPNPKELVDMMDIVEERLHTEKQYEGFGYTHETLNISEGPIGSRYTRLDKMTEKMEAQLKVAKMIRAVDATDVVSRVIGAHFIPDLIGNLNKFCVQETRCTSCNRKYRRPPLSGECQCGGNLTLTVHEGSVKKYLRTTIEMTERFDLPPYLKQRIEQLEMQINSLFDNDKVSTPSLDEFC